jgi:hypothetical protein
MTQEVTMSNQNPDPTVTRPEPDAVDHTDDVAALRNEAANRRRALRAVEAERDRLRERLDSRDRRDVEALAAARFADPRDVSAVTSLDDFRGDDGMVDMARVESEFDRIAEDRPHWRKPEPVPLPDFHQGPRTPVEPAGPSFGQSLKRLP